jgi:hypothetical protein
LAKGAPIAHRTAQAWPFISLLTKPDVVTNLTTIQNQVPSIVQNLKEGIMVEVTTSAKEQIAEYFKGKDVAPIRIFLNEGG